MSILPQILKSGLKTGFIISLFLCVAVNLHAQENAKPPSFSSYKGVTAHLLVQPGWQNKSAFDGQLQTLGYPTIGSFGVNLGIGISYLFKTGTSVGLEFAYLSASRETNSNFIRVQPHLYVLNVKQYFSDLGKARLFVGASLWSVEQQYTVSQATAPPTSIVQAIIVRNASRFQRHIGGLGASLGITFKGNNPTTQRFTDFVEIESGYRFNVDTPYYTSQGTEIAGLPGDRFRQFYVSIRAGLFVRAKQK